MVNIKTVYESSNMKGNAHVSCTKYKNLINISHYHSDHELIYVNEGSATVAVNENIFNLNSSECVFIHCNEIHYIQSDRSTVITVLKAESKYFEKVFTSKKLLTPFINKSFDVKSVLRELSLELRSEAENNDVMADSIATQFFITMLRNEQTHHRESITPNKQNTNELYNEICRKISNEYRTITFEAAAKYMHFSEPYFSKVFHSIFGMTFTQYLNTIRIAAAIEKLKQGHISMPEISSDCGFNTIRNFNRVFKKFTGYSPNSLPTDYVFLYNLQDGLGLDPTLNCTEILEW